jgi:hypothetical protein
MPLKPEDHKLSMKISPRGKIDSAELRQLFVNRLTATVKSVMRRSLRDGSTAMYCEGCSQWRHFTGVIPIEWTCQTCKATFRMEFAVYEHIDRELPSE